MYAHKQVQVPRQMKYDPQIETGDEGIQGIFPGKVVRQPEEQTGKKDAREQAKSPHQDGLQPAAEEEFLGHAREEGEDQQVDGFAVRKDWPYLLIHFFSQPGKWRPVRACRHVQGGQHWETEQERQEGRACGRIEP